MDSNNNNNNNNNSSGSSDGDIGYHFLPTSTTSPHFFDLPPFHLDSPFSFPHLLSSSPPTATSAQRATPECINPAPAPSTSPVGPTRPSKKRSRASRRAPTTVLTTDTSNFRAMVQEFTGITAPPFSSSSSTSASTSLHFPRSFSLNNPTPSFLLKPFPHKFQSTSAATSNTSLPISEFDFRRNPNSTAINFQSLLQSQLVNLPQPPAPNMNSSNSGGLDLPGTIGPGGETCKLNFTASAPIPSAAATAEFRVEKVHGSTTTDGREGLMESWICSSD